MELNLTEGEAQKFWPIYEEYQKELDGINGRLGRAIDAYATQYNAMSVTDEKAKALMDEALAIEDAELMLKKNCLTRLEAMTVVDRTHTSPFWSLPRVWKSLSLEITRSKTNVTFFEVS